MGSEVERSPLLPHGGLPSDFRNMREKEYSSAPPAAGMPHKSLPEKMLSVAYALMFGKGVSLERRQKRFEICTKCPNANASQRYNDTILVQCGICGCKVRNQSSNVFLLSLAKYEETNQYGCRFPGGSRWKAAGV